MRIIGRGKKMAPKLATGYERLAISLGEHIKFYQPGGWIVPISNVVIPPMFTMDQARTFMAAHESGNLQSRLE